MQELLWSFFFLIGKLYDPNSSCPKLFEILYFCSFYTLLYLQKNKNVWKYWQKVNFYPAYLKRIGGSYSFTSNLKMTKWKLEIGSFFLSKPGNYKTLPVPAQNYQKYSICSFVTLFHLFKKKSIWKRWPEVTSFIHLIFEKTLLDLTNSL